MLSRAHAKYDAARLYGRSTKVVWPGSPAREDACAHAPVHVLAPGPRRPGPDVFRLVAHGTVGVTDTLIGEAMADQIPFSRFADLVEGRLDAVEAEALRRQLAEAGPEDRTVAEWIEWFGTVSARFRYPTPPVELVERVRTMMAARPTPLARLLAGARSFACRLVEDMQTGPMLAGARSVDLAASHQLLFEAPDGAEISVQVRSGPGGLARVDGQVLADQPVRSVALVRGNEIEEGVTDAFGEFAFAAFPVADGTDAQTGPVSLTLVVSMDDGFATIELGDYVSSAEKDTR